MDTLARVLRRRMDVHAGGADLAFPHHAYHAAIAEAFSGVAPYTRAWFRGGTVRFDGRKMAKSTGNLVLLKDLLAKRSAEAVRMMILDRPWRESWEYRPRPASRRTPAEKPPACSFPCWASPEPGTESPPA